MKTRTKADRQGCWLDTGLSAALVMLAAWLPAGRLLADESPTAADHAATVSGTLFICGGGRMPDAALQRFIDYAGGSSAHVVVITTASETADSAEVEPRIDFWRRARMGEMTVLHTRSRETANDPDFCKPFENATGVWFIGGHQHRLIDTYRGTKVEQAIRGVLERGGVVGGTSAGAAVMSPIMIKGGNPQAEVGEGFGFLPGTVIDQHFLKRKRQDRLLHVLAIYPKLVGVGIDEGAVVVVRGRRLSVIKESESSVVTCLAPVDGRPAQIVTLKPGTELDLVALRRTASTRVQPRWRFDDAQPAPALAQGTLVLAGGGDVPSDATRRFIDAAGGNDASIVVVTTADGDQPPPEAKATGWLTAAGANQVCRIHVRTPQEAEDPAVLDLLRTAGGVWFTGGRQWRLVDAFHDTAAERLFQEVLKRGGAIGGSAAGASIVAAYLVRGNPLTNKPMMAQGYEEGFGFLPCAAVDPFFSQRNRFADMAELKQTYPQLVGLGLDEGTAIVVHGQALQVMGRNRVCVFDRREPAPAGERDFDVLAAGDRYDLAERCRLGSDEGDRERIELAAGTVSSADEDNPEPGADDTAADNAEPKPQPALVCE
ncbi:MAG: cyanophycinase [Planctomycetaceae bacterium]|nr:cyanophycinase [Planctomycetaceae bacterium]